MNTFEIQDEVYGILVADSELLTLLGTPSTEEELNNRVKREFQDMSTITTDNIPMVIFTFIDGYSTNNFLVTKGLLEFEVYCWLRYDAQQICKRIMTLMKSSDFDLIVPPRQIASGIPGVVAYGFRYKPLVTI